MSDKIIQFTKMLDRQRRSASPIVHSGFLTPFNRLPGMTDSASHQPSPGRGRPVHQAVMAREVVRALNLSPGKTIVDGTAGAGGHSKLILDRIGPSGRLLAIDRDPYMLGLAAQTLGVQPLQADLPAMVQQSEVVLHQGSYLDAADVLARIGWGLADGFLLDLGLSSDQLADDSRGYSFHSSGLLDMRFDPSKGFSANDWLRAVSIEELTDVLEDFGEVHSAKRLATEILAANSRVDVWTGKGLGDLVEQVSGSVGRGSDKHAATQVFQALRIAVNRELDHVREAVTTLAARVLKPGGVLAIISFHSTEDRIVKQALRGSGLWEGATSKPVAPTPQEFRFNPRSRSAKLRVVVRAETDMTQSDR